MGIKQKLINLAKRATYSTGNLVNKRYGDTIYVLAYNDPQSKRVEITSLVDNSLEKAIKHIAKRGITEYCVLNRETLPKDRSKRNQWVIDIDTGVISS